MKKIFFILIPLFIFLFSITAFCENPVEDFARKNGELYSATIEASNGNIDFWYFLSFFKKLLFEEFSVMKSQFALIFIIVMISSLMECISFGNSVSKAINVAMNILLIIASAKVVTALFISAKECIENTNDFMLFSVPYYCSLLLSCGKPLASAKGSMISLGSSSILSQLISNVFFPFVHLFYVVSVSSALIENDIFKSLKKFILSCEKVLLPFIVGIYTTILTLFVKTSSHSDTFVFNTAKATLSSAIPFLGNILSQSSDAIFSSIGLIQSQIGIAGVICLIYIVSAPLLKMLAGILMFRLMSVLSCFFGNEKQSTLFDELSDTVSILASMIGTMGVIVIISIMLLI